MAKNRKGVAFGVAAVAAGVGYLAGVLTAPKSGKETRKDIQHNAHVAKLEAEKKLKELHADISGVIDEGKLKAKSAKSSAKDEIDKLVGQAEEAKTKAREVLSAIHEGGAEDADLEKAIKNAKNAVANLKTYLKKHA